MEKNINIVGKSACRIVVGTSRVACKKEADGSFVAIRDNDDWEIGLLQTAIGLGMNWIDTARSYGDAEVMVGRAISNFPRENVVVTTKVGKDSIDPDGLKKEVDESCQRLGTTPDMILLHDRHEGEMGEEMDVALETIMRLKDQGLMGGIGISNFRAGELERAIAVSGGSILVYEAKVNICNPRLDAKELKQVCDTNNVVFMASSALNRGQLQVPENIPIPDVTLQQYGILVLLALGLMPIVQSHNPEHMKQNIGVLDMVLPENISMPNLGI